MVTVMNRGAHQGWQRAAVAAVVVSLATAAGRDADAADPPGRGYAPDHVVIRFKAEAMGKAIGNRDPAPLRTAVQRLFLPPGATLEESGFVQWLKQKRRADGERVRDEDVDFSERFILRLPKDLTPEQCVARLKDHPLVEHVGVDPIGRGGATPTDPDYGGPGQWYLRGLTGPPGRIFAPEAWDITTGTNPVIVAVLDSGCNTNLAEFSNRVVQGYNFIHNNNNPLDDTSNCHGTAVAGILCANANNAWNGAGVDWNCKLMPIKVLNSSNEGPYTAWTDGVKWAMTNGAKVINLSAGGWFYDGDLYAAITNAIAHGIVFVTITHNKGYCSYITFPGSMSEVITVGGIETNGQRCSFSNTGTTIDLVAPGTNIYCLTNNGGFWSDWGTSYAAPQAAGVAALILSRRPELNHDQVCQLLCAGAEDRVSSDTNDVAGWDQHYGWGKLNAYHSLLLAESEVGELTRNATNGTMSLAWSCPTNAAGKRPYRVEYAVSVTGGWTAATNITYGQTNAAWTDADSTNAATRFYRIQVKQY